MSIGGIRGSNYFTPEGTVPFCQHNQPRERDDDELPFHPPPPKDERMDERMVTLFEGHPSLPPDYRIGADPDPGDARAWTRRETHNGRMPLDEDE